MTYRKGILEMADYRLIVIVISLLVALCWRSIAQTSKLEKSQSAYLELAAQATWQEGDLPDSVPVLAPCLEDGGDVLPRILYRTSFAGVYEWRFVWEALPYPPLDVTVLRWQTLSDSMLEELGLIVP